MVEAGKKCKISEQTRHRWRERVGALEPADVKRLRALEAENARLKRLLAKRELVVDRLKEINRRKW